MTDARATDRTPGSHAAARRARAALAAASAAAAAAVALTLAVPARAAAAQPALRLSRATAPAAQTATVRVAPRAVGRPSVPAAPAGGAPTGTAPDPRLAPDEVVTIVLEALAVADARDGDAPPDAPDATAGVPAAARGAGGGGGPFALVFAFASPGNRAAVGSLERFEAMVRDESYRPLLHHQRAARGVLRVDGDRATQRVVVTSAAGQRVAYTFVLARQRGGDLRGCWLTESVTREAPSRLAAPFSA